MVNSVAGLGKKGRGKLNLARAHRHETKSSSVSKTKTQFCKNCVFVLPGCAMRDLTQNHGFISTAVKINARVLGRRLLIISPWGRNYIVRRFESLTKAKQLAFYRAS